MRGFVRWGQSRLIERYDVVVVGAGPAGSMAARAAAGAGARVLVLDRRKELGVPVQCGEALSEDPLRELGIKPKREWIASRTNEVKIVSPSGIEVRIAEKKLVGKIGYVLDRKVFDKYLATLAARAGAEVRVATEVVGLVMDGGKARGVKIRGFEGRGRVEAKVVIAADGVVSRVARWAGLSGALRLDEVETCAQFQMVGVELESSRLLEFYFGSELSPGGYAWVFPKGRDAANVGVGVLGSRAEHPPIYYLRRFIDQTPELKNARTVEVNGGVVPVGGPLPKTFSHALLVVGDAARQVNPLTGGGIDNAMRAGDIAGKVAAQAVAEGDTSERRLQEYERRWRELLGKRLRRYLEAKNVLLSLTDEELDKLASALRGVRFERISLTDMLRALLRAHPKLLWKLRRFL